MCECDATVRDLQASLMRAQEALKAREDELVLARGTARLLSISMSSNSEKRGMDEAHWQRAARWLARQIAIRVAGAEVNAEMIAMQWLAYALEATAREDEAPS